MEIKNGYILGDNLIINLKRAVGIHFENCVLFIDMENKNYTIHFDYKDECENAFQQVMDYLVKGESDE